MRTVIRTDHSSPDAQYGIKRFFIRATWIIRHSLAIIVKETINNVKFSTLSPTKKKETKMIILLLYVVIILQLVYQKKERES